MTAAAAPRFVATSVARSHAPIKFARLKWFSESRLRSLRYFWRCFSESSFSYIVALRRSRSGKFPLFNRTVKRSRPIGFGDNFTVRDDLDAGDALKAV